MTESEQPPDPLRQAGNRACEDFIKTIQQFNTQEEATEYAAMMIALSAKLMQGTLGAQYKKQYLKQVIKDPSAIVFADLGKIEPIKTAEMTA